MYWLEYETQYEVSKRGVSCGITGAAGGGLLILNPRSQKQWLAPALDVCLAMVASFGF